MSHLAELRPGELSASVSWGGAVARTLHVCSLAPAALHEYTSGQLPPEPDG